MRQNIFNDPIPEIKDLLANDTVRDYVETTLMSVLDSLGIDDPKDLVTNVLELATSYDKEADYETSAHQLLNSRGVTKQKIGQELSGRADLIYSQIKDYVSGKVLDLGCGDGKVGERLSQDGLEVILADIYEHDHIDEIIKKTNIQFHQFNQGERVPLEGQYDTVLLLTVLHHSENSITGEGNTYGTLDEAKRLTRPGGNIILIESVYGINPAEVENPDAFTRLTHENQRLANIFFDHFYNRVIHYSSDPENKVPVPYNFNTPKGWNEPAEGLGLKVIATKHLGRDQKIVPEDHSLHVYEA